MRMPLRSPPPPRLLLLLALLARRAAAQAAYSEAVLAPRLLANIDALMQEPLAPVQLSLEASAMEFLLQHAHRGDAVGAPRGPRRHAGGAGGAQAAAIIAQ